MQLISTLTGAFELVSYAWVYQHCRLFNLSWDSSITWWLAFFMVDFTYYWFHRMAHGK